MKTYSTPLYGNIVLEHTTATRGAHTLKPPLTEPSLTEERKYPLTEWQDAFIFIHFLYPNIENYNNKKVL